MRDTKVWRGWRRGMSREVSLYLRPSDVPNLENSDLGRETGHFPGVLPLLHELSQAATTGGCVT